MNNQIPELFKKEEADTYFKERWKFIADSWEFTDDEEEYHMKGLAEIWFFWGWATAIYKGATLNE